MCLYTAVSQALESLRQEENGLQNEKLCQEAKSYSVSWPSVRYTVWTSSNTGYHSGTPGSSCTFEGCLCSCGISIPRLSGNSSKSGHPSIRTTVGKQWPHVLKALKLQEYVKIVKQLGVSETIVNSIQLKISMNEVSKFSFYASGSQPGAMLPFSEYLTMIGDRLVVKNWVGDAPGT